MALARLPHELIDLVVDVVASQHYPRLNLLALAQTCHTISSRCRRIIFEHINLRFPERITTLVNIVARDPAIPGYIKDIAVVCSPSVLNSFNSPVLSTLRMCDEIKGLSIKLEGRDTDLPSLNQWNLQLPLLRYITLIQDWQPISYGIIEALLSTCNLIENLRISSYGLLCDSPFAHRRRIPVKRLTLFLLQTAEQEHITRLGETIQGTEELVLYLDLAGDLEFARAIIATVASNLQKIELFIKSDAATRP